MAAARRHIPRRVSFPARTAAVGSRTSGFPRRVARRSRFLHARGKRSRGQVLTIAYYGNPQRRSRTRVSKRASDNEDTEAMPTDPVENSVLSRLDPLRLLRRQTL